MLERDTYPSNWVPNEKCSGSWTLNGEILGCFMFCIKTCVMNMKLFYYLGKWQCSASPFIEYIYIYIYSPSGVCHIFEHLPLDPWAHLVLPPPPDSSVKTVGWGRTVLPTNPPHVYIYINYFLGGNVSGIYNIKLHAFLLKPFSF